MSSTISRRGMPLTFTMDIGWLKWAGQIALGFLGGVAAYFALPKLLGDWWLERIKRNYARQLEFLRTSLEKSTIVTRAHFETEFAAMKEVSQCLAQVKILYRRLNPLEAGKELTGDALEQCITEFGEAIEKFLVKLEEYAVFLTPEIYVEFERCHIAANIEFNRFKTDTLNLYPRDKSLNADHFLACLSRSMPEGSRPHKQPSCL